MVSNPEYDLSKPLATALKAAAPYVGIPVPGHAPLAFDRLKLYRALKGVKPLDIRIEKSQAPNSIVRILVVEGVASEGRVRTRLRMPAIPVHYWRTPEGRNALATWKDAARPKPKLSLVKRPKGEGLAVTTVKRLKRELDKLPDERRIPNPAVPRLDPDHYEWQRRSWAALYAGKRLRREVGAFAKRHNSWETTSRELYTAMRERGWEFTSYSAVRQPMKDAYAKSFHDYLKNLWRFVKGTGGNGTHELIDRRSDEARTPWSYDATSRIPYWGPARYRDLLDARNHRRSLQAQIDSIAALHPNVKTLCNIEVLTKHLVDLKSSHYGTPEAITATQATLDAERAKLDNLSAPQLQEAA